MIMDDKKKMIWRFVFIEGDGVERDRLADV